MSGGGHVEGKRRERSDGTHSQIMNAKDRHHSKDQVILRINQSLVGTSSVDQESLTNRIHLVNQETSSIRTPHTLGHLIN